jgi:predicted nucleic acid-binding protein
LVAHVRSATGYVFVPATSELTDAGLSLHAARPDKEWSLTGCISFIIMTDRGIQRALAHDYHFEQAGFEALLRRDPP